MQAFRGHHSHSPPREKVPEKALSGITRKRSGTEEQRKKKYVKEANRKVHGKQRILQYVVNLDSK